MNDDQIHHEVHELFKEHLDRDNVGKLKTEIAALCIRVRDEERKRWQKRGPCKDINCVDDSPHNAY